MYYTKTGSSMLQAHRGVSTEFPENTMAAYTAAAAQGYEYIELDPAFTAENIIVLCHDATINRTGRKADGSVFTTRTYIDDFTLDELKGFDFGSSFSPEFAGEPIPTLEEVLLFALENKIKLKFDDKIQTFRMEALNVFFDTVERCDATEVVSFTSPDLYFIEFLVKRFPTVPIHYAGYVDEWWLKNVKSILRDNPLYTWLRYDNAEADWCKLPPVSDALVKLAKKYGDIGIWLLADPAEADIAVDVFEASIIETNGTIKPNKKES